MDRRRVADEQVQLRDVSAPPDQLSQQCPPSTGPSPSFKSQHPRCTHEPCERSQHRRTFNSRIQAPLMLGFWGQCHLPSGEHSKPRSQKQNKTAQRRPTSPPQGLLSPPLRLMVLSEPRGGSVRPQSPGWQAEHGAWGLKRGLHTHARERHSGVSATRGTDCL